jgi:hypothetical protein
MQMHMDYTDIFITIPDNKKLNILQSIPEYFPYHNFKPMK